MTPCILLLPFRWVYRGLVWLANSPRTLILSYLGPDPDLRDPLQLLRGRRRPSATPSGGRWSPPPPSATATSRRTPGRPGSSRRSSSRSWCCSSIPLITAHFASKLIVDTRRLPARGAGGAQEPTCAGSGCCWRNSPSARASPCRTAQALLRHRQIDEVAVHRRRRCTGARVGGVPLALPGEHLPGTRACSASSAVFSYGVAGSPVVPTTTIGGAPVGRPGRVRVALARPERARQHADRQRRPEQRVLLAPLALQLADLLRPAAPRRCPRSSPRGWRRTGWCSCPSGVAVGVRVGQVEDALRVARLQVVDRLGQCRPARLGVERRDQPPGRSSRRWRRGRPCP